MQRSLVWAWQDLPQDDFPLTNSAGSILSWWEVIPGSLRAGGAVHLHRSGESIFDLLWAMRLQHQHTLSSYLQEVTASSILPSLDLNSITLLQCTLPIFMGLKAGPGAQKLQPCVGSTVL